MEIAGLAGKQSVAFKPESPSQARGVEGVSFLGSIAEAVKAGKIVMPGGVELEKMDFNQARFTVDKGLKVEESEEEQIKGFLTRIKRTLEKTKR